MNQSVIVRGENHGIVGPVLDYNVECQQRGTRLPIASGMHRFLMYVSTRIDMEGGHLISLFDLKKCYEAKTDSMARLQSFWSDACWRVILSRYADALEKESPGFLNSPGTMADRAVNTTAMIQSTETDRTSDSFLGKSSPHNGARQHHTLSH